MQNILLQFHDDIGEVTEEGRGAALEANVLSHLPQVHLPGGLVLMLLNVGKYSKHPHVSWWCLYMEVGQREKLLKFSSIQYTSIAKHECMLCVSVELSNVNCSVVQGNYYIHSHILHRDELPC